MTLLRSIAETAGVALLAGAGWALARWAGRKPWPRWLISYGLPLVLLIMIAVARWTGMLEYSVPFRWFMADRTEFALLAFIATSILLSPLARAPRRATRVVVVAFMVWFVGYYALLPFLLPGLCLSYHRSLRTFIDKNGVCRQSTDYTCGPAAAVTALRHCGVMAEEGELTILAHTTDIAGTPGDSLCAAIDAVGSVSGITARYCWFENIRDMKGKEPVIALVKYGPLVDHYVTVIAVTPTNIAVADPLLGLHRTTHEKFLEKWRHQGIVLERAVETRKK